VSNLLEVFGVLGVFALFAVPIYFIGKSARKDWQPKTRVIPGSNLATFPPMDSVADAPASMPQGEAVSDELRSAVLDRAIVMCASKGGRVEYRSQFQAVVVYGKPVNHVLHAILTVFTCLLWAIVWLFIAQSGGERREVLDVDPYGNLHTSNAMNLGRTPGALPR
jgi:hypothetical protein